MDFLTLNGWKILRKFILCTIIWSAIGFIGYLSIREDIGGTEVHDKVDTMLYVLSWFSMSSFVVFFLGNWNAFYKARRLLSQVLILNIFDDDEYSKEYLHRDAWWYYTAECNYGKILGYPVVAYAYTNLGKYTTTKIEFYLFFIKSNKTIKETLSFTVRNNTMPENLKQSVINYVSNIKNEGYEKGNISSGVEAVDMADL